jgi:hypothetical protein
MHDSPGVPARDSELFTFAQRFFGSVKSVFKSWFVSSSLDKMT